jgi:hypothetical protein
MPWATSVMPSGRRRPANCAARSDPQEPLHRGDVALLLIGADGMLARRRLPGHQRREIELLGFPKLEMLFLGAPTPP